MDMFLKVGTRLRTQLLYYTLGLFLILLGQSCLAQTIIIPKNLVIYEDTTYSEVTLDMTAGSIILENNATLTIKKCTINGTLSETNPVLFNVSSGTLRMKDNTVTVNTFNLNAHPATQSLQHVIQVAMGKVHLKKNTFSIDKTYTAGLLLTTASIPTTDFVITNNSFKNFHGVLYLLASDNALVSDNNFFMNSYGHIVSIGNHLQIIHNTIAFSGNDRLGNAIDIIDSDQAIISRNLLLTPTCHGIYVLNSHHVTVDSNRIYGGITYAMTFLTYPEVLPPNYYLSKTLASYKMKHLLSSNIVVTNNFMSQNRFGLAATDVDGLNVDNNIFIQRFTDANTRKFWTNNAVLLSNVSNVSWTNNIYKEAFTQSTTGDNSQAFHFVPFPMTGGVVL